MTEEALTPAEVKLLRSIAKGLTPAEWRALKALASGLVSAKGSAPSSSNGGATHPHGDELPDHFLDSQDWADREITRDPKKWAGDSMVGFRYSQAPSEWLTIQASALEFKAMKGRESPTPRLQTKGKNAGKPWHEADSFEAKICRAWARRNKGRDLPPERETRATVADSEFEDPSGDGPGDFDPAEDWVP